jgi:tetratricopeptide (TPR) repeat protein
MDPFLCPHFSLKFHIMLPRAYFAVLFLFVQAGAIGQNQRIDSLTKAVESASDPIQKVELLNQVVAQTWDFSFEKGLALAEQAYAIAGRQKDKRGLAYSGTSIGMYYYFKADYPTALKHYWRALQEADGEIYGDIPAFTLVRLGNLYRVQGHFDSSRLYYDKALLSLNGQPEGSTLSSAYYNLGLLQIAQGEFNLAAENIDASLRIRSNLGDSLLMAESWRALGMVYKSLSDYKKAREYYF